MSRRVSYIPQDFFELLRAEVPGFVEESPRNQWGLAYMAWHSGDKTRRHLRHPGFSFSSRELEELFGRNKYLEIQIRVPMFTRSADWSMDDGLTRAYLVNGVTREALDKYASKIPEEPSELLWLSGDRLMTAITPRSVISSTGSKGSTIRISMWDGAKSLSAVRVDRDLLRALCNWCHGVLKTGAAAGTARTRVEAHLDMAAKLLRIANSGFGGVGCIPQVYFMSPSGRLYAGGANLQNAPRLVKQAALNGCWEYDFANCHFTIVSQMATNAGVTCRMIDHYLKNKVVVRRDLAAECGLEVEEIKQCLLAVLYGAKASHRERDAIPSAVGLAGAKRLYEVPFFKDLLNEVDRARKAILDRWIARAGGRLVNAFGLAIADSSKPGSKLAHLLQGVEAQALATVVSLHPGEIVLLQHDGFTALRQLNATALAAAASTSTGYALTLEEKQLILDEDDRSWLASAKSEIGL